MRMERAELGMDTEICITGRCTTTKGDKCDSSSHELLRSDMATHRSHEFATEVETCNHEPFN